MRSGSQSGTTAPITKISRRITTFRLLKHRRSSGQIIEKKLNSASAMPQSALVRKSMLVGVNHRRQLISFHKSKIIIELVAEERATTLKSTPSSLEAAHERLMGVYLAVKSIST